MSKRQAPDSNNNNARTSSSNKNARLDSWLKGASRHSKHNSTLQKDDAQHHRRGDRSNQKSLRQPSTGVKLTETGVKPIESEVKPTKTGVKTTETELTPTETELMPIKTGVKTTETETQPKRIHLVEETGDLFAARHNTVLIHACNCEGSWGGGIAKAFKDRYPEAYAIYNNHCRNSSRSDLPGTALLIPPQSSSKHKRESTANHFIGCLFTSQGKGKTKSSPEKILADTGPSMLELLYQIGRWNGLKDQTSQTKVGDLRMCKINSGLFDVPWADSKAVLEELEVDQDLIIVVVERD